MIYSKTIRGFALGITLSVAATGVADASNRHVPKRPQRIAKPQPAPSPKVIEIEPVSGKAICWVAANGDLVIPDGQNQCISRDRQWTKMR